MLLALWPSFIGHAIHAGKRVDADLTHRAIRGKEVIKRTKALEAAEEHIARLQAENVAIQPVESANNIESLPQFPPQKRTFIPIKRAIIPAYVPKVSFKTYDLPAAELVKAMRQWEERQAENDDEEAIILALLNL
jgi:hypothetical protein